MSLDPEDINRQARDHDEIERKKAEEAAAGPFWWDEYSPHFEDLRRFLERFYRWAVANNIETNWKKFVRREVTVPYPWWQRWYKLGEGREEGVYEEFTGWCLSSFGIANSSDRGRNEPDVFAQSLVVLKDGTIKYFGGSRRITMIGIEDEVLRYVRSYEAENILQLPTGDRQQTLDELFSRIEKSVSEAVTKFVRESGKPFS